MRKDHPAARDFDQDSWLAFPHIVVSGRGERQTPLDAILQERRCERRIGPVVPNFAMVPPVLRTTSILAMLPARIVMNDPTMTAFEPPIPMSSFTLSLAWHRRKKSDRALRHVAERLASFLR